jgi:leucyl aminopeptidase
MDHHMADNFIGDGQEFCVPIVLLQEKTLDLFLEQQPEPVRQWIRVCGFSAQADSYCLVPNAEGGIMMVLAGVGAVVHIWSAAFLPAVLPERSYLFDTTFLRGVEHDGVYGMLALGWGLAGYRFDVFRKAENNRNAMLYIPETLDIELLRVMVNATCYVRDMINLPANHMGPTHLALKAIELSDLYGATCKVIVGDDLLSHGYPAVHAVGRASDDAPRLIDLRWGREDAPKVSLVGKGVCFDSGGLDIKGADNMKLMKKDMGGAAHVLGLAKLIMHVGVDVRLRVLIPAVENSISSNAFRPLDVIPTRKGLTIEIGNTDAEGRVILADALYEAATEHPDLLIDCATLTGAARVALGTDMPAYFTDDEELAIDIQRLSSEHVDPLWRLPLFAGYEEQIKGAVAHLNNAPSSGYAGAITAALFLKRFCEGNPSWVHVDMMAWNLKSRAGRPEGGEAMGLRTLFALIMQRYGVRA